jgi:glycerol-3-phosphate dehydrogenase (NAD(P)+)
MGQIAAEIAPNSPYAVLTGPNLAKEIAQGVPAAAVIFSSSGIAAASCQQLFHSSKFRVYTGSDVVGAELAGALKNVYAIAAGASDAMGFGWNSKAAFLTRSLAEMVRLGRLLGARPETFYGLAGVGDLFATAASSLSRNYRVGWGLAQGKSLHVVLAELGQVAEGVPTAQAALQIAGELGTEVPLLESISSVLFSGVAPREALANLMRRVAGAELKPE